MFSAYLLIYSLDKSHIFTKNFSDMALSNDLGRSKFKILQNWSRMVFSQTLSQYAKLIEILMDILRIIILSIKKEEKEDFSEKRG